MEDLAFTIESEKIGEYTYAVQRRATGSKVNWTTDWRSLPIWGGASVLAFFFAWIPLHLVRIGSPLAGPVIAAFGFGIMAACYGALLFGSLWSHRTAMRKISTEAPRGDSSVPRTAMKVICTVRTHECVIAKTVGTIWLEGPFLLFRGAGFDFKIGRGSISDAAKIVSNAYPWQLRLPVQDKLPWFRLSVWLLDASRELRTPLRSLIETWDQRAGGKEETVLPPIVMLDPAEPLWPVLRWALIRGLYAGAVAGAMMLAIFMEAPAEAIPSTWARVVPGAALLVPLMMMTSWWSQRTTTRSIIKRVEALRQVGSRTR